MHAQVHRLVVGANGDLGAAGTKPSACTATTYRPGPLVPSVNVPSSPERPARSGMGAGDAAIMMRANATGPSGPVAIPR